MKYVDPLVSRAVSIAVFLVFPLFSGYGCFSREFSVGDGIAIDANEIRIRKNESLMVFSGNIRISKEKLKIFVKKTLTVHYANVDGKIIPNSMDMIDLVATNDVGLRIIGDRGYYDFVNSILTIRDNVVVSEKNSVIFVDRAIYDTITEEINMFGRRSAESGPEKKVIIIMDSIDELGDRKNAEKPPED
jgi:lipopolysaccharide export system protein LptA